MVFFSAANLACGLLATASSLTPVAASSSHREQSVFGSSNGVGPYKDCKAQNVTLKSSDDKNFVFRHGKVSLSETFDPTVWTLEKDRYDQNAWQIFARLPDGKKACWYSSGNDISIDTNCYSNTRFYIKFSKEETSSSDDDDESGDLPESVVIYTDTPYYLSISDTRELVHLNNHNFPEDLKIEATDPKEWEHISEVIC